MRLPVKLGWLEPGSSILDALRGYGRDDFAADVRASLPVAAVALPQSMAFAMLAGFPPSYGLYTAIVGGLLAGLFGNSRHVITSVNNAVCLMVASIFAGLVAQGGAHFKPGEALATLAVLVGLLEMAFIGAGLVSLSQFISHSVLQGFMLGTACLIAFNQAANLIGVPGGTETNAVGALAGAIGQWEHLRPAAVAMSGGALACMLLVPRLSRHVPAPLVAVVACAAAVAALGLGEASLPLVAEVPRGLPALTPPSFDPALIHALLPGAAAVTILGAIEAVTIGTVIAGQSGQRLDNNRQLFAQGMANVGCGLLHGLPCSASFTRSFLNLHEGARTHLSGILASVWILATVLVAGPLVHHVPRAALAGVLVVLAARVPKWDHVALALRATKSDAFAMLVTFFATLFLRLDMALYIGVGASLLLFLKKASAPHLVEYALDERQGFRRVERPEERAHRGISILHVEGELFFGAAEVFEREVRRIAEDPDVRVLILRLKNARNLDATSLLAIRRIAAWLPEHGRRLLICGVAGKVRDILERGRVPELIGRENFFASEASVLASTREALRRAQELVGAGAEVRVFFDSAEEIERLREVRASEKAPAETR